MLFFSECLPGFFKQLPGNRKCEKCPLYSKSTDIAATFCACADGFFRSKSESVKKACSGKSVSSTSAYQFFKGYN